MSPVIIIFCVIIIFLIFYKQKEKEEYIQPEIKYINNNLMNSGFINQEKNINIFKSGKSEKIKELCEVLTLKTGKDYINTLISFFGKSNIYSDYIDNVTPIISKYLKGIPCDDHDFEIIKIYAITQWIYSTSSEDFDEYIDFLEKSLTLKNPKFSKDSIDWKIKSYNFKNKNIL